MRNPQAEAYDRVAHRYEARVLEPSPPAVEEPPWFADDPVARGELRAGRPVVSPVSTGDYLWDDLARDNPSLGDWCADRWLGAWRRLEPAPPDLAATRESLHRIAEDVMKPARERANGKFGLRYTHGGFGTPFFGEDEQVRVEGTELVFDSPGGERRQAIDDVDPAAVRCVADWYGFAASVLEQLRAEAPAELEPSRVQLWPEHFDMAVELGPESAGRRAGYGCSPGDEGHPEPYVYVVPWEASAATGEGWNAGGFAGAELAYGELLGAEDQRACALDFLRGRLGSLTG
jgi:hypothetical protein